MFFNPFESTRVEDVRANWAPYLDSFTQEQLTYVHAIVKRTGSYERLGQIIRNIPPKTPAELVTKHLRLLADELELANRRGPFYRWRSLPESFKPIFRNMEEEGWTLRFVPYLKGGLAAQTVPGTRTILVSSVPSDRPFGVVIAGQVALIESTKLIAENKPALTQWVRNAVTSNESQPFDSEKVLGFLLERTVWFKQVDTYREMVIENEGFRSAGFDVRTKAKFDHELAKKYGLSEEMAQRLRGVTVPIAIQTANKAQEDRPPWDSRGFWKEVPYFLAEVSGTPPRVKSGNDLLLATAAARGRDFEDLKSIFQRAPFSEAFQQPAEAQNDLRVAMLNALGVTHQRDLNVNTDVADWISLCLLGSIAEAPRPAETLDLIERAGEILGRSHFNRAVELYVEAIWKASPAPYLYLRPKILNAIPSMLHSAVSRSRFLPNPLKVAYLFLENVHQLEYEPILDEHGFDTDPTPPMLTWMIENKLREYFNSPKINRPDLAGLFH